MNQQIPSIYPQGVEVIIGVNNRVDIVCNGSDDSVHNMHNPIGGVLICLHKPCAVHCHDLQPHISLVTSSNKSSGINAS